MGVPRPIEDEPRKRVLRLPKVKAPNPLPSVIAVFWILLGLFAIEPSLGTLRVLPVLAVMGLAFSAGVVFGRAEQAREILLRDRP